MKILLDCFYLTQIREDKNSFNAAGRVMSSTNQRLDVDDLIFREKIHQAWWYSANLLDVDDPIFPEKIQQAWYS